MDNLHPQSGRHEQHEESDLSIRAIVIFGLFLVVGGVLSFVAVKGLLAGLERGERQYMDPRIEMTSVAEQNKADKQAAEAKTSADMAKADAGVEQQAEDIKRRDEELHVIATFPEPRLQYNEARDMDDMKQLNNEQLNATGKDANGNIHIPIEQAIEVLAKRDLPPVSGTFMPVNMAPTSVIVPPVAPPARPAAVKGAAR